MKLDRGLLVLDVETTGTNPETSSIIQIGVVKLSNSGDVVDSFNVFVKPYTDEWTEEAFNVHHISKAFLEEKGISIFEALEALEKFVDYKFKDYYIAQWSSSFDIAMLRQAYKKAKELKDLKDVTEYKFPYAYRVFDVASFVRLYLASLELLPKKRVSLRDCAEILKIEIDGSRLHDASYDALLTSQVLIKTSNLIHDSFQPFKSLCLQK